MSECLEQVSRASALLNYPRSRVRWSVSTLFENLKGARYQACPGLDSGTEPSPEDHDG